MSMRSKARRWSGVGSASVGTSVVAPVKRIWLRVRVAKVVEQAAGSCAAGCPGRRCWVEALASAPAERCAGATGLSRWGVGAHQVNVIGAQAWRRCQTR